MAAGFRILIGALPLAVLALAITSRPNIVPTFTISPYGLA